MNNKMIAILVVLYDKEIDDSATISSLMLNKLYRNINLTIINNGPRLLSTRKYFLAQNEQLFNSVRIIEYLDNKPLSKIYNEFLSQSPKSDYYIFFDDDSSFLPHTIADFSVINADIILPRIRSKDDKKYYYPLVGNDVASCHGGLNPESVMSITSGLCLARRIVALLSNRYGSVFDENFALYGIDTSFFLRLHKCVRAGFNVNVICHGIIYHSLSRANGLAISKFRLKERLYDAALITRHYPDKKNTVYLCKKLIQNTIFLRFDNVWLLIKTYVTGKHPRCR